MSEAVHILIDAEDRASKKMAEVAANIDANVKRIKDVGGKAKASTEFIGTLANSLGGSELGSYASQLAGMTEKVGQFSEVSKAGSAGALAFKLGLVGLVGTLSFQFGKAIGDAIAGTAQHTRELERAAAATAELEKKTLSSAQAMTRSAAQEIDLIRDPEEKKKAQEELLRSMARNVDALKARVEAGTKATDEWANTWFKFARSGDTKQFAEMAAADLDANKARLEQERELLAQLRSGWSERAAAIEKMRADNAAAAAAEQQAIAAREAALAKEEADRQRILALQEQETKNLAQQIVELTKGKEAAKAFGLEQQGVDPAIAAGLAAQAAEVDRLREAKEREQAVQQKTIDDAARVAALRDAEIQRLKEYRIETEQGTEAVRAFRLEQQGLDKGTAQWIAAEEKRLEAQRKAKEQQESGGPKVATAGDLTAVQSRLRTRGSGEDKNGDKIARWTEKTAKELEAMRVAQERERNTTRPSVRLELVN